MHTVLTMSIHTGYLSGGITRAICSITIRTKFFFCWPPMKTAVSSTSMNYAIVSSLLGHAATFIRQTALSFLLNAERICAAVERLTITLT